MFGNLVSLQKKKKYTRERIESVPKHNIHIYIKIVVYFALVKQCVQMTIFLKF